MWYFMTIVVQFQMLLSELVCTMMRIFFFNIIFEQKRINTHARWTDIKKIKEKKISQCNCNIWSARATSFHIYHHKIYLCVLHMMMMIIIIILSMDSIYFFYFYYYYSESGLIWMRFFFSFIFICLVPHLVILLIVVGIHTHTNTQKNRIFIIAINDAIINSERKRKNTQNQ